MSSGPNISTTERSSSLPDKARRNVAVLGAGLAGLAAAQRLRSLGHDVEVFERNSYLGGHASTHGRDGFLFDEGPHVSFTKRDEIKTLLANSVNGNYIEHKADVTNYWNGLWIKHPAQTNLHGLPPDVVTRCIVDAAKAQFEPERPTPTYADWCVQGLGRAFSEEFTFKYTRKYWTAEANQMTAEWAGTRVYRPKFDEMVRGAIGPQPAQHHYITEFRYPREGGFASYVNAVSSDAVMHLGQGVSVVDLKRREIELSDGTRHGFEALISSLPLPELIRRVRDVPAEVAAAAELLVCTSLVLINVGVNRADDFPAGQWQYFYDDDIVFARGNFPHRLSPGNAPPGCGSIQLEVYHSKYRPLPSQDILSKAMEDLHRIGILRKDDRVHVAYEQKIPYANVLFDLNRTKALDVVNAYLKTNDVTCCGRYGEWAYLWTDDSIISGWSAAERICSSFE